MRQWKVRIVKVGGSLLDCATLGEDLRRWLDDQTPAHNVLVVGGGEWAELVRQADDRFGLSQSAAHWLCIRAMRMTARLLAELLPEATLAVDIDRLSGGRPSAGPTIIDPWSFLRFVEPQAPGPRLPESWDVTSDSIAARLAMVLAADELVLLKSAAPGAEVNVDGLVHTGYVDSFFATLAPHLAQIRCVDFRTTAYPSWIVANTARRC